MKFTIELSDAEVAGIKKYLKEVDGTEKPSKADVQFFAANVISSIIHCPQEAVSYYVNEAEKLAVSKAECAPRPRPRKTNQVINAAYFEKNCEIIKNIK